MTANWWKDGADKAENVWSHIKTLEMRQRTRVSRDFVNEKIYASSVGMERGFGDKMRGGFMPAELNFTRTIIDALVARVGNDRPAVKHASDGADWCQRRQAKQFDKVIEGEIEALEIPAMGPMVMRDALVTRGGVGMVTADNGQIVADRVPCEELIHDERESRYGKPRQMHRVMRYSKEVLAEKFDGGSKMRAIIENAPPPQRRPNDIETGGESESGMVECATSWHLPSGTEEAAESDKKTDGKRVISVPSPGGILLAEDYRRDHFPFAVLRWSPPRRGYWGASLVDELASLQFKVNEVARDLMQNIYFTSAVKVITRRGANIEKKHVPGKAPHFIEVEAIGADLEWKAPDGFSAAQFQFLQWLIQQMFEVSGVSQLMAQGKNSLGAGASGAALNEVYQQDSERFSQLEQAYARWWCDMGRLIMEAAQDLAEDEGFRETEVRWSKGNVLQKIKWKDVDLDSDRFELHLEPSGFMPQTRAGKMQAIEQLIANGMVDPKWATSLIDYPDLKRAQMVQNAPLEWCLWAMEEIADCELKGGDQAGGDDELGEGDSTNESEAEIDEDKSRPIPAPDPHMDLDLAMSVAKASYQIAVTEGTPEPILARYLEFMDALDAEKQKLSSGAPAMPAGPPAPMGGMPGPMPPGAPPMPMNTPGIDPMQPPGGAPMLPPGPMA